MKNSLLVLLSILFSLNIVTSCSSDDDNDNDDETVSTEDRIAQAQIDQTIVTEFMSEYTYNFEDFENDQTLTDLDIVFRRLTDEDSGCNCSLEELAEQENGAVRAFPVTFENNDEELTEFYYVIKVRQGAGDPITYASDVNITFQEKVIIDESQYEDTFDNLSLDEQADAIANPIRLTEDNFSERTVNSWSNSLSLFEQLVIGFPNAITNFNIGTPLTDNSCEIFQTGERGVPQTNNDFGIGIVIVPSGLARFDNSITVNNNRNDEEEEEEEEEEEIIFLAEEADFFGFRNIVYTFSLYNTNDADLDEDGIPNSLEDEFDVNGVKISERSNSIIFYDSDDDGLPNYLDNDDDDDEVLTISEIELDDFNNELDSDCDGNFANDLDVKYIFSVINTEANNQVQFTLPNEQLGIVNINSVPFHLNSELEFDEDDFEVIE